MTPTNVSRKQPSAPSAPVAYALSLTRPVAAPAAATHTLAKPQPALPPNPKRQWAVQVAALATANDAEKMANSLRNSGYDAYVITFANEGKTWHRVRIGRFVDIQSAMQLKNSLIDSTKFKQAYVAAN